MATRQLMRAVAVCAVLVVASAPARAAWRMPFTVLGLDQGLPSGMAVDIAQDRDGFVWLGTENGLVRYEGGQHRRWSVEDGLPSAYVSRLQPTPDGALWLATQRGLIRFVNGRFEPARLAGSDGPTSASHLGLDRRGRVWVATPDAVFVQRDGLDFDRLPWDLGRVLGLVRGSGDATYVSGTGGLRAYLDDGTTRTWGAADGLPAGGATVLAEDGAGRLWAGSGSILTVKSAAGERFDDASGRLRAPLAPNGQAYRDADGSVWLPTQDGALHLAGELDEVLGVQAGLPFRWVRSVFRDREGTLWVLGPSLARLEGGGRLASYAFPGEVVGSLVWFVARGPDGALWVAGDDGVARVTAEGFARIPGTEGRRVKAIAFDRRGIAWMVSSTGPALWLERGAERARVAPIGALGELVNHVMVSSRGAVWLAHAGRGVLRWDPGARRLVEELRPDQTGARSLAVSAIREDPNGRLWAGLDTGLGVRDPAGRWRTYGAGDGLEPFAVRDVAFLPDGTAWLAYGEPAGLTRVRIDEAGRLVVLERRSRETGLRTNQAYALQVDTRGHLWVSGDQGLDRLDPPLHVDRHDGLPSEDCSLLGLLLERDRLYAGTASGLVRYDTGAPDAARTPPRAWVLSVKLGGRTLETPFEAGEPEAGPGADVEFKVAAPSYASERGLRFQVRLAGLEDAWRDTESRRFRYPALPGGHYRFEARVAGPGTTFGPVTALGFAVRSPWWRTWWAWALWVGAAGVVMFGLVRLRVAALARSKASLEVLVEARTAELHRRNEELSAALGEVRELSGLLPICMHCKKIRNDTGYWERIESYLSKRTGAAFSHGLCPDCYREHHGHLG